MFAKVLTTSLLSAAIQLYYLYLIIFYFKNLHKHGNCVLEYVLSISTQLIDITV